MTPISGVVASVDVKAGDEAGPGAIAIRVADHSAWEVVTSDLNEAQVAKIDEGAPVALSLDALPRTTATSPVSMVGVSGEPYQLPGGSTHTLTWFPPPVPWSVRATTKK